MGEKPLVNITLNHIIKFYSYEKELFKTFYGS